MILVYRQIYEMVHSITKRRKDLQEIWKLPITDVSNLTVAIGMGIMMLNKMDDSLLVCDAFMGVEHKQIELLAVIEDGKDIKYRRYVEDVLTEEGTLQKSHYRGTLKAQTKYIWKEQVGPIKVAASLVLSSNRASVHYVEKGPGSQFRVPPYQVKVLQKAH